MSSVEFPSEAPQHCASYIFISAWTQLFLKVFSSATELLFPLLYTVNLIYTVVTVKMFASIFC